MYLIYIQELNYNYLKFPLSLSTLVSLFPLSTVLQYYPAITCVISFVQVYLVEPRPRLLSGFHNY